MPGRLHASDYAAFVEHLVAARRRLGVKQTELAERLARPQSYISKVERLERRMDIGEWRDMARAIGINPVEAFTEVSVLLEHSELLAGDPSGSR
jgi:ribosome-binding protein aMBF1 (putative translation factor)